MTRAGKTALRLLGLILLAFALHAAHAASVPQFRQNLGARLPLATVFRDEQGHARRLADYFGASPVVVVFGYYRCPRLCSTVMDSVLQAVGLAGLPHAVVGIGIDPRETPDDAARKLAAYRRGGDGARTLHLLTGRGEQISRLARAAGFEYEFDQKSGQYSHTAGFLIATPDGRISRYFTGVQFDRRDLRLALMEASEEKVGSLADQVVLLCSHYDPVAGRYTLAVMTLLRTAGILTVVLLAGGLWLLRRRASRRGRSGRAPQARPYRGRPS